MNSTMRGYLWAANCSLPQATSASSVASSPAFLKRTALISSPCLVVRHTEDGHQ